MNARFAHYVRQTLKNAENILQNVLGEHSKRSKTNIKNEMYIKGVAWANEMHIKGVAWVNEGKNTIKIDSTQKRIAFLINEKGRLQENIEWLLEFTDERKAYEIYAKLYKQIDEAIAEEAALLIKMNDEK